MKALACVAFAACMHASPAPTAPAPAPEPTPAAPEPDAALRPLAPLIGAWQGTDPARHTSGRFTLVPELGGKVLVRHNHDDTPQGPHDDLMVIYAAKDGLRASYFDNEGHVIAYAVTAAENHVELVSDAAPGAPRFKLTYDLHGNDELAIDFAIAPPGTDAFQHFTGGVVHRAAR
ncbi:MAG TPA: hypothetical protein VMJ10_20715 [Kofleriaceae bacterium]|nr:hypothetical protein [Kofleriaceae bacterium]